MKVNENFTNTLILNFGPQHPAAHGVLRLLVELKGEYILGVDPHIGLLHRGTEKLIEYKNFMQCLPYMDRLDYVSMMVQEHCFSLAIEYFMNIHVFFYLQKVRLLFDELTRLLNHLLTITTHALDVGALTPFLWAFEEREKLMSFYEQVSGARLHAAFIRPSGLSTPSISKEILNNIDIFVTGFLDRIYELDDLLTNSRIWKQRLCDVGIVTKKNALNWGFSGVMVRGSGIPWDLRKTQPYGAYNHALFNVFNIGIQTKGDCYSRYKVRIIEMIESSMLIQKVLRNLKLYHVKKYSSHITMPSVYINNFSFNCLTLSDFEYNSALLKKKQTFFSKVTMEALIDHFKMHTVYTTLPKNKVYVSVEAPKGEFGIFAMSNGTSKLSRCKIKAPGFLHLQGLDFMSKQHMLSDLVTNIGTQDIVFGEVDR